MDTTSSQCARAGGRTVSHCKVPLAIRLHSHNATLRGVLAVRFLAEMAHAFGACGAHPVRNVAVQITADQVEKLGVETLSGRMFGDKVAAQLVALDFEFLCFGRSFQVSLQAE